MMENKKSWICNSFVISAVLSGILAFVIDVLERRSFYEGLRYLYHNPLNYIVNVGIIFFMMSIVWMVRRRMFVYVFVSILWLAVGITNFVILGYRNTPFTFVDIQLAAAGLAVMDKYMSSARIVALVILIVVLIAALILFFVYGPRHKKKISYIRNLLVYLVLLGVYSLFLRFCISNEYIVTEFGNIKIAYEKYGVPYCFGITLIDNGIDRPADYGEDSVEELEQKLDQVPEQIPDEKPNIVFVQLESFFDVTHMKKLKLSEDPIPNFRSLKENYSHGFLHMPSYGAGTANSEFELITGMNRSYFGCGEYPYKSVLQKKTCESIPYALQDIGYSTHVVHNNRAQFYDRDLVFTHLGFQSFTSLECMAHTEKTYNGWTKDHVLTKEIMKSLRSTPGKDYVYTISVEGHGEYPVEKMENPEVSITGGMKDKERRNRLEHYINQTREMDKFVGDLVHALSYYNEKTIVVFYGDHLPSLDIERQELDNDSIYETEYVIWSNYSMKQKNKDYAAYQLGAMVLKQAGITTGNIVKLHQTYMDEKDYQKDLKLLQYDQLYGKNYLYRDEEVFPVMDMQFGVAPLKIKQVKIRSAITIVKGREFTPYTRLFINDERVPTKYLNQNTICFSTSALQEGDVLSVRYLTKDSTELRRSKDYILK